MVKKRHMRKLDHQMDSNKVLLCLKYHKKVAKSMVNNNSQPLTNLWPSACLLRATTAISRPSKHYCTPDMPQKTVPAKADLFTFDSVSVAVS